MTNLLTLTPDGGVERVIVVEALPQFAFDQDGFGKNVGELFRVMDQGGLYFSERLRCLRRGVDALDLGGKLRGRDFEAVNIFERRFFLQVERHERFQNGGRERLLERWLRAEAMVVIDPFDRRAVGDEQREIIHRQRGAGAEQNDQTSNQIWTLDFGLWTDLLHGFK